MNEVYWSDKRHEMEGSDWSAEDMARAIPYMLKERVEKFRNYGFDVKGLILDAGTGVGIDILALKELGLKNEFVGIDISRKSLIAAKRKLIKAAIIHHLVRADVCFPPFIDEVFDGITANNVVHHHPLNTLRQIFRRFNKVMRKGGTLLINEPCVEGEECGLFGEMESFVRHLWGSEELLGSIPEDLREYLYHTLPIFGYGGLLYPTIMREILTEAKFEIEILEQTFPKLRYEWMFHEVESAMKHLELTDSERKYLLDKIEEFKEKINIVKSFKGSWLIIKAKKAS